MSKFKVGDQVVTIVLKDNVPNGKWIEFWPDTIREIITVTDFLVTKVTYRLNNHGDFDEKELFSSPNEAIGFMINQLEGMKNE